ncbi:MAG: 5'-methylthioadenosine/adenosylhomocysteine nucleosidase [Muribaculaceae bacterium]|nr:5'-methylthioadenosine/adenosylhomocysteine nucleosidase [Muribaculaceae bacterium]
MTIGIIVAMGKELDLLKPQINDIESIEIDGTCYWRGNMAGKDIVAMQCGIGKVNAAIGCMTMIQHFHPDLIINTGVAGGTGSDTRVMDVVVANGVAYHDVWCGPGTAWGQAAECPNPLPTAIELLQLPCLKAEGAVKHGLIASGDIFVDNAEVVAHILKLYPQAKAVDMESAALAQTCYRMGVPFFCMRVMSDTPGQVDNNAAQYENFWGDAPKQTFSLLTRMINEMN